jgi:hypothetical protein
LACLDKTAEHRCEFCFYSLAWIQSITTAANGEAAGYSHNEEEITFDYPPIIIVLRCEKLSDVAVIEFGKLMNENCSSRS